MPGGEAIGTIKDIVSLGVTVYEISQQVKKAHQDCASLGKRVRAALAFIPSTNSMGGLDDGDSAVKITNSLINVHNALAKCGMQINQFADKNLTKLKRFKELTKTSCKVVFKAKTDSEKFQECHQELDQTIGDMILVLTIRANYKMDTLFKNSELLLQQQTTILQNNRRLELLVKKNLNRIIQKIQLNNSNEVKNKELNISIRAEQQAYFTQLQGVEQKNFTGLRELVSSVQNIATGIARNVERINDQDFIINTLHIPMSFIEIPDDTLIGTGSFGNVLKGNFGGEVVAVKVIDNLILHNSSGSNSMTDKQKEFFREIKVMNRLHHPRIVRLYGASYIPKKNTSTGVIVMEYMTNGSTSNVLPFIWDADADKYIKVKIIQQICKDIVEALHYMHGLGCIHRDLRLDNVLIDGDWRAKITDFGLSKNLSAGGPLAPLSSLAKKVPYRWRAPETFKDNQFTDKSDVYSLSLLFWTLWSNLDEPYFEVLDNDAGVDEIDKFFTKIDDKESAFRPEIDYENTPAIYARFITEGWRADPKNRPSVSTIRTAVKTGPCFHEELPKKVFSNELEVAYREGMRFESQEDKEEAKKAYEVGSNNNDQRAQYALARLNMKGGSIRRAAYDLLLKAAHNEDAEAQYELAKYYSKVIDKQDLAKPYLNKAWVNPIPLKEDIRMEIEMDEHLAPLLYVEPDLS